MTPRILSFTLSALPLLCGQALAGNELSGALLAQTEARHSGIPGIDHSSRSFQLATVRGQFDAPWEQTLRGNLSLQHERDGSTNLQVNELTLERPLAGGFFTAGKKVMSWDVGYAFRPLDVVQQEDRRALNPATLEGIPMLAQEAFDDQHALTMVLSNPGHGKSSQPRDDEALALRLYRQRGERDEYLVLRLSERNGVETGAAFSQVLNQGVEVHGSFLWQEKHDVWRQQRWIAAGRSDKAMAGFTWTTESQFSVIAEVWRDRSAIPLQQRNVFLRAAQNWDSYTVSADLLWQPESRSAISTLSASWKHGPWLLAASWRHYGGLAGTFTRQLAIATIERSF